jgi:hypothetical protein
MECGGRLRERRVCPGDAPKTALGKRRTTRRPSHVVADAASPGCPSRSSTLRRSRIVPAHHSDPFDHCSSPSSASKASRSSRAIGSSRQMACRWSMPGGRSLTEVRWPAGGHTRCRRSCPAGFGRRNWCRTVSSAQAQGVAALEERVAVARRTAAAAPQWNLTTDVREP